MVLLKNGTVETDLYTDVSSADKLPEKGAILVSLTQWQDQGDALTKRLDALGIVLQSDEKPEHIANDLAHFDVIALEFPTFNDGRAYSYARLLRERYNYQGELRAVGDVLLEQLHFMHRVGFNSFNIQSKNAIKDWEVAAADISIWYQPSSDNRTPVIKLRHDN
ncbi:MAG: DUF934 domain-containing protein [Gammaproteobacteria bacterium]|nr:DUF934 domain-containing protein [Gammaproteobacteria bacterium]MCP4090706.1 DUF934 domain-containing protein [Gammaproteobacteria bacterium]MCP4277133.1 DUF934 domain-containing protein [Gammaproteobacteria bacterium]MCP4832689.1 DUF934 domain-containing protein [Gammaproteobacteria bacterium]MCP4928057.1 DUF934 domain-containing protein [Gammaproteobacteria bacterium]